MSHVVQSAESPLLPQEARVGPPDISPGIGIAGALDHSGDVKAPGLGTTSRIAETSERNTDLDLISAVGDPALRLPGEIGVYIGTSRNEAADLTGSLAPNPVALNSQRVHPEEEGSAAVVKGCRGRERRSRPCRYCRGRPPWPGSRLGFGLGR